MEFSKALSAAGCWLVVCAVGACGQSVVEHSLATAAGSAGAAAGKGVGKSIGGVFDKLGKTLEQAGKSSPKPGATASDAGPAVKPKPAREFPDPKGITVGLAREELLSKFGEPSMKTTDTQGTQLVETYWYTPAKSDAVVVTLRDGKVTAVTPESRPKQQEAAVIVLQ